MKAKIIVRDDVRGVDRKTLKWSKVRLIRCGNVIETYEYDEPYFYNLGRLREKEFDSEEVRCEPGRRDSIARSRRKVKRLINSNVFVYGRNPIFATYTFEGHVSSIREANRRFKKHIDDVRRDIVGRSVRYLGVPEIQGRRRDRTGVAVWHFHVVFFDLPWIPDIKEVFAKSWGAGWVQIKAIDHVRNVGAYVSKYFSKQWMLDRVKGQKAYYTSCNLFQPEVYRDLTSLSGFAIVIEEYREELYSSKYGRVLYRQLRVKN